MISQAEKIFVDQSTPGVVEIVNLYGCENMTLQVECNAAIQLNVLGRANPQYEYKQMSAITDAFDIATSIVNNGVYSFGIGGRGSIRFELVSVGPGGSANCHVNLF